MANEKTKKESSQDAKDQKSTAASQSQRGEGKGRAMARPEGASVLTDEGGDTTIYQEVVAKIAGIAVREIDGVHRLVPFSAGQQVSSVARSITGGNEMRNLGVRVEVGAEETAVDVRIVTGYGASIPAVAEAIRRNVADRIEGMTGLQVVEVNIDVVDLYFSEDEQEEEEPAEARRVR